MKKALSLFLSLIMVMGVFFSVPVAVNAVGLVALEFELNEDGVSYSVSGCDENATGEIVIPDMYNGLPVTRIGECGLEYNNASSITIGENVTVLDRYALSNSFNLTTLSIPDSVVSIESNAIKECVELSTLIIGTGLKNLADAGISECSKLTSIEVDEKNEDFYDIDGVLFRTKDARLFKYPEGKTDTEYTIPEGTKEIGWCAIRGCKSLESITIPEGVTRIGMYAFEDSRVTSLTIPKTVTKIDDDAFRGLDYLINISVEEPNYYYSSEDGVLFDNRSRLIRYPAAKENLEYEVPFGTYEIAWGAFQDSKNLASVTLPETLEEIGYIAFSNCENLTNLTIPSSVRDIDYSAFGGCKSLTSLTINNGITKLKGDIFWGCSALESVNIPNSVTSIGSYIFYNCHSLKSVTIPSSVTVIGDNAFGKYENDDYETVNVKDFTIYGVKGTAAEMYANKNGFSFIEIEEECLHGTTSWIIEKEATCTEEGCKHQVCMECGEVLEIEIIPETSHTSSNWITDAEATVNAAGSQHKECTICGEVLETAVIPQLKPATPKLTKIANTASGVQVTWGKVTGADNYVVYRKTYDAKTKKWSGWTNLGKTTSASYVDKTAKSGTYYLYTVKAVNEAGASGYDKTGIKTYFLARPTVTTTNANAGVTVKWTKSAGATGYYVYRKTTGGWTKVATVKGAGTLSYTDKTAKAGTTYKYTVKAYYGSYVSAYNTSGVAVRRLTTPTLKSVTSAKAGVTTKWNKVTGATGYIVYRKTGNGGWVKLATVSGNSKITYLDKTAKKGVTYTYTVKAYYGSSTSAHNTKGLTIKDKY